MFSIRTKSDEAGADFDCEQLCWFLAIVAYTNFGPEEDDKEYSGSS